MDTLETISAETSPEDELKFLTFARRNRHVRIISSHANLDGPVYLSINDLTQRKTMGTANSGTILLWNSRIPNPLCWNLFLLDYDQSWKPINPEYGTPIQYEYTGDREMALHESFRRQPITRDLFRSGMFNRVLSPVIELSLSQNLPMGGRSGFSMTAAFALFPRGVWLVWNGFDDKWEHESRDLQQLHWSEFVQPPDFIAWQTQLFNWIRENWADKIKPPYTYRILESGETLYYKPTSF